jgi:hypothetical protein
MYLAEPNRQSNGSEEKTRQSAYADDLSGGGTLRELKRWWDLVLEYGPLLGYYAKPSKSWLILKEQYLDEAKTIFAGSGVQITTEGQRHLGAVLGSETYKHEYVTDKINTWIEQLKELGKIARVEPHIAYCAYVFGLQHRYTYLLRTIPDITAYLEKLDEAIDEHLLKHILHNYKFSDIERLWFSLPTRLGGLGINIMAEIGDIYHHNSKQMTRPLVEKIVHQHGNVVDNEEYLRGVRAAIKEEKRQREERKQTMVVSQLDSVKMKLYEAITEQGASSWLTTLPLKIHDLYLNKQTFWDSIYLRYGIQIPRLPSKCVCSANFTIEHAMTCKKGGFISIRHNDIRDFTAEMLTEVCKDVAVEPILTPLSGETFRYKTANTDECARLDVSARGVWVKGSRAFFDVRVFNPLAPTYSNLTLKASHKTNEDSKKREYGERILNVEHGTFTPLVFSSLGGMSPQCSHFYNHLADKISEKRMIPISKTRSWMRTKLSFCLLRATHLCIRGSRTKRFEPEHFGSTNIPLAVTRAGLERDED